MTEFANPFAKFDEALALVISKKAALDDAQAKLNNASKEYTDAVDTAQELRAEINDLLGGVLPGGPKERVRVSS